MNIKVRYTDYVNSGKLKAEISFDEFLKLFINHKQVVGEELSELKKVFKIIGKYNGDQMNIPEIEYEEFMDFLKTRGEMFKEKDFNFYFKTLTGNQEDVDDKSKTISHGWLMQEILKIKEDIDNTSNIEIVVDSQERVLPIIIDI